MESLLIVFLRLILEGLLLAGSVACFSKTEGFPSEGLRVCCVRLKVMGMLIL